MFNRMNVYLVSYTLKHNGEQVDNVLHVGASTFEEAYHIANSWRNKLRHGAVYQELVVRDIKLIVDKVQTNTYTED